MVAAVIVLKLDIGQKMLQFSFFFNFLGFSLSNGRPLEGGNCCCGHLEWSKKALVPFKKTSLGLACLMADQLKPVKFEGGNCSGSHLFIKYGGEIFCS